MTRQDQTKKIVFALNLSQILVHDDRSFAQLIKNFAETIPTKERAEFKAEFKAEFETQFKQKTK